MTGHISYIQSVGGLNMGYNVGVLDNGQKDNKKLDFFELLKNVYVVKNQRYGEIHYKEHDFIFTPIITLADFTGEFNIHVWNNTFEKILQLNNIPMDSSLYYSKLQLDARKQHQYDNKNYLKNKYKSVELKKIINQIKYKNYHFLIDFIENGKTGAIHMNIKDVYNIDFGTEIKYLTALNKKLAE